MQGGVGGLIIAADNVVMSAGGEFAYHRRGQVLLDVVGLRAIGEGRDGEGMQVRGQLISFSSDVIAAAGERERNARCQHCPPAAPHWILPRGRAVAISSAISTAAPATMRRLSAAAHTQMPF